MNAKFFDIVLSLTADAALEAALASVGFASYGGTYQMKEPEMLRTYAQKRNADKGKA